MWSEDSPAVIGRLLPALAFVLAILPAPAMAQSSGQLFSNSPSTRTGPSSSGGLFAPSILAPPAQSPLAMPPAPPAATPMVPAGQSALVLGARFGKDAAQITNGLTWRIYAAKADASGAYRLIKEDKSAAPTLVLPAGAYVVHVGFGLATAVRPVKLLGETVREEFDLPAGGLRLEGRVGDARIPAGQISFDVYKGSQFETGDRRPIAEHVMTGDTVVMPEGTYYIVSNYGDANSTVRSDIRVQAGKLTDITVTHRAAAITLKLVSEKGGEALANTAWSVLTPGGDVIKESIGAFPRVILAEGEYRAIARNEGKVFEREFKVVTGVDGDVEVLAR
ncbi:MAG TPA: hypothetical protein VHV58_01840 [Pseudolabrys sp.]|jgi:hypothetical protein|nr:hypothetical protein [Pseudolabrys sp.]